MKSEKRKQLEEKIIALISEEDVISDCDECDNQGVVRVDPYIEEIHDKLQITSLCKTCWLESIQNI